MVEDGKKMVGCWGMVDEWRRWWGCPWVLSSVIVWYIWPCVKGRVM